jgi:ketosteroid isomerase-like protein
MPEKSTTPDLVELGRRMFEAASRRDFDTALSFFAPDAVWETVALGTTFEGVAAIRGFWQDWWAGYEELWVEQEEAREFGNGVTLAVVCQEARPVGTIGHVTQRAAWVFEWTEGMVGRVTTYYDRDEARAAAERLARSRG